MDNNLMKCGHVSNATCNGKPCCAICYPTEESLIITDENPDLTGRESQCMYCSSIVKSSFKLPFFEYKPNDDYDSFYDGCRGWN